MNDKAQQVELRNLIKSDHLIAIPIPPILSDWAMGLSDDDKTYY